MNKKSNKNQIRELHNRDLLRRMKNGDSLTTFDSYSSWFPPRPVIQKNKKEMARLYNSQDTTTRPTILREVSTVEVSTVEVSNMEVSALEVPEDKKVVQLKPVEPLVVITGDAS